MLATRKGFLAIIPPEFKKIEAEIVSGIARIQQRTTVQEAVLVMDGLVGDVTLKAGSTIILSGEAGMAPWAKKVYNLPDGQVFALCPENDVIGYRIK